MKSTYTYCQKEGRTEQRNKHHETVRVRGEQRHLLLVPLFVIRQGDITFRNVRAVIFVELITRIDMRMLSIAFDTSGIVDAVKIFM